MADSIVITSYSIHYTKLYDKVAPSRFQGMMQAGWLLATATGNKLLFVGTKLWDSVDLWQMWIVFIGCSYNFV